MKSQNYALGYNIPFSLAFEKHTNYSDIRSATLSCVKNTGELTVTLSRKDLPYLVVVNLALRLKRRSLLVALHDVF